MIDINLTQIILQFLLAIQGVESNHGKMTHHRTIASEGSMHYGQAAMGRFALMPATVAMFNKSPDAPMRVLTDPRFEKRIARKYALKVLQAAGGCPLKASVLWLKGHGARPKPADYQTARFRRFVTEWETVAQMPIDRDPVIQRFCL